MTLFSKLLFCAATGQILTRNTRTDFDIPLDKWLVGRKHNRGSLAQNSRVSLYHIKQLEEYEPAFPSWALTACTGTTLFTIWENRGPCPPQPWTLKCTAHPPGFCCYHVVVPDGCVSQPQDPAAGGRVLIRYSDLLLLRFPFIARITHSHIETDNHTERYKKDTSMDHLGQIKQNILNKYSAVVNFSWWILFTPSFLHNFKGETSKLLLLFPYLSLCWLLLLNTAAERLTWIRGKSHAAAIGRKKCASYSTFLFQVQAWNADGVFPSSV